MLFERGWVKASYNSLWLVLVLTLVLVLLPQLEAADKSNQSLSTDNEASLQNCNCRITLVESIPQGVVYKNWSSPHPSTFSIWKKMIGDANETIEIGSYYWTLRENDIINGRKYPGSEEGEAIFQEILNAGVKRKIKIKIAQNQPSKSQPNVDTDFLQQHNAAEVRNVNMPKLIGNGILHTKLWVVDRQTAYVGSANMDWRSLTQVKELGIYIETCHCLVQDIGKLFDVYWKLGEEDHIPQKWPDSFNTKFNLASPLTASVNDTPAEIFMSSSPPQLCVGKRTVDIDAILHTIKTAKKFIYISVMDYVPLIIYTSKPSFWPIIDDALREAAVNRGVELRLLISKWPHTLPAQIKFLKSLQDINGAYKHVNVAVKLFVVPTSEEQKKIPHARVNHNKYMVTDNVSYIGTSNWSGDYFVSTAGVGAVITGQTGLRQQLEDIFLRDWNSDYAFDL